MASGYSARGSALGLAEQSQYDTAVSRTNWLRLVSSNVRESVEIVRRPNLYAGTTAPNVRAIDRGLRVVEGTTETIVGYNNVGMLLKHIMGGLSTTGSGPYTHVYTHGADPIAAGLTMELLRSAGGQSQVFAGCTPVEATWSVSNGQLMRQSTTWIGRNATAKRASGGTPAFGNENPVRFDEMTVCTWDGDTYSISSFEVFVRNPVERRYFLGSDKMQVPKRNDYLEVGMRWTLETNDLLVDDYYDGTKGELVVTFTDGDDSITFSIPEAYIVSHPDDPPNTVGPIPATVEFAGIYDSTSDGLTITVVNDNTSGISNG